MFPKKSFEVRFLNANLNKVTRCLCTQDTCEIISQRDCSWGMQNENFGFLGFKPAANFALYAPFIDGSMARDVYAPPHACGAPPSHTALPQTERRRDATSHLAAEIGMHTMRQIADAALSC